MAQRPPQRYDPGELDKVRGRLGDLSRDEAQRMAKVLGGEVGAERQDDVLEQKYRKLADLNRRRSDRFVPPLDAAGGHRETPSNVPPRRPTPRPGAHPVRSRRGYFSRLRMDFLAARAEHQMKSIWNALAAIFSFAFEVEDIVSPRFIKNADAIFYTTIENLVIAVRKLVARYEKTPIPTPRIQYFKDILAVIKGWEIEKLSAEIARLQASPRRVPFEECAELCRLIFAPMVRLADLEPNYHIGRALKHFHDVDMLSLPQNSPDVDAVKLQYTMSRDMQLRVFVDLRHRLYPLLLKLASPRFCSQGELFSSEREALLAFLHLKPEQIIPAKELKDIAQTGSPPGSDASGGQSSESTEPNAAEGQDGGAEDGASRAPSLPEAIEPGLGLLDDLFPQAGWRRILEFPDMYPYFQPIFEFPRGAELIPPEDPLQQVMVLLALLQEFFYGFRAIQFGTLLDEHGNSYRFGDTIEGLTENWHLFLDELLGKNYLSLLDDYAHQEGHTFGDRRQSEYSEKLELDLLWTKRRYLLPKLDIKIRKGLRPNVSPQVPKLWETVRDVRAALEKVVADIQVGRAKSIENLDEDFSFAVESFVSKRLRAVLGRQRPTERFLAKRTNNASLVYHTLSVLRVFDYLLNDQECFYYGWYNEANHPLVRRDPSRGDITLFTVPLEDPFQLIERSEAELRAQAAGLSVIDPTTGTETARSLSRKLTELVHIRNAGGAPFVMLPVLIRRYNDLLKQTGKDAAEALLANVGRIVRSEIRDFSDHAYRAGTGSFVLLLPETSGPDAVHLVERLGIRFSSEEPAGIEISMGVIEHQAGWTAERLVKAAQEAIREAARIPSPAAVIFSQSESAFVPVGLRGEGRHPRQEP